MKDSLKVVPIHAPSAHRPDEDKSELWSPEAGHAPAPAAHLAYQGGALLGAVEVFTVFWGSGWGKNATLMGRMNAFFDFVLTSPLMDELAQYGVPGQSIGHGTRTGTAIFPETMPRVVTDAAIQGMLETRIGHGALPRPNPNSLFFVYLPRGVAVAQGGSRSCQAFCGYHDSFTPTSSSQPIYYAAMPYPGCTGCTGGLAAMDALTSTSSHELCEAITDPVPGEGWVDTSTGNEIGDICAWRTRKLGEYVVQLEWSNKAGACV